MRIQFAIFLCLGLAPTAASAGYVQNFVDLHGGCQNGVGTLSLLEDSVPSPDGRFLDKKASEWTDEELEEYRRVFTSCLRLHPGEVMTEFRVGEPIVAPPGAIEAKVDATLNDVMRKQINPARAARRQEEASIAARRALQDDQERSQVNVSREQARQREAAANDRRELERARERERRTEIQAQAKRDREAAEKAQRLSDQEAPEIAATEREASDAHRARLEAEKRLGDVRNQIATAQNKRVVEDAAIASAKAKRLQIEQRAATLARQQREDDALARTCSISADQFGRIALGMSLREVQQRLGCVGSLTTSTEIEGVGAFHVYRWTGAKSGTAAMTTFNGGKLVLKTQDALD